MMVLRIVVALVALGALASVDAASTERMRKNPIRKVVTMLQDMQKGVEEEGKNEANLFDKFMCYCSSGKGALEASIEQSKASIESLGSTEDRLVAEKSQLTQDVTQHKADREEAEKVVKESTSMREKEAGEFAAKSGDMKSNIQSMDAALAALKNGNSAALLQTSVGNTLKNVIATSPAVRENERAFLLSFLESGDQTMGGSDQVIGIVEQMKETYEQDLAESANSEEESKAGFATLMTSKQSEIGAAGKAVETKTARSGEVAVEAVQAKADLEATTKAVAEDTKFAANLDKECATKQKEQDERVKIRAEEIEAISDTIEMLNSDDALELFKKSLPSASAFMQTATSTQSQTRRATAMIQRAMAGDSAHAVRRHLVLAELSNGGKYDKMIVMLDGMVTILHDEQAKDDELYGEHGWCITMLEKTKAEVKQTGVDIDDLKAKIEASEDVIAQVSSEIEALQAGLADLDKSVAEATEQRKKEHESSSSEAAGNMAAVELLGMAKNRMNKFYNPSQYKEAPKKEDDDFFAQVSALAFAKYRKSEGSNSIISMMDEMIKETEMDMAEAKRDEEEAQKDYQQSMDDAATKRTDDSKLIVTKEGEKAEQGATLEDLKEGKRTKSSELDILEEQVVAANKKCDFGLHEYKTTKESRAKEVAGLEASKQVLAGLGFLQKPKA